MNELTFTSRDAVLTYLGEHTNILNGVLSSHYSSVVDAHSKKVTSIRGRKYYVLNKSVTNKNVVEGRFLRVDELDGLVTHEFN
jgi:hypothetical protein